MELTAICNAGVLLNHAGTGLLIDGISRDHAGFSGLDDGIYGDILQKNGIFSGLSGLFFTHCHPDHFDAMRVQHAREILTSCRVFTPDEEPDAVGTVQCGPFSVSWYETEHLPYKDAQVRHAVFLIKTENCAIYILADAISDAEVHRKILNGIKPDVIFVNPMHLSNPAMREFLHELMPKHIYTYHIPTDPEDRTGMRRKTIRTAARDYQKTVPITLVTEFPMYLGEV